MPGSLWSVRILQGAFHFLRRQCCFMPRMSLCQSGHLGPACSAQESVFRGPLSSRCSSHNTTIQKLAASTETKWAAGSFVTQEVRQRGLFIIMSELYTHRRERAYTHCGSLPFVCDAVEGAVFFYTLLYTTCTLYLKRVHPVQVCLAVWVYLKKSMHLSFVCVLHLSAAAHFLFRGSQDAQV